MTLNDPKLVADIIEIQEAMIVIVDPEAAKQQFATLLAQAIKEYLMSGTVTITGSSTAGPITGTGLIT